MCPPQDHTYEERERGLEHPPQPSPPRWPLRRVRRARDEGQDGPKDREPPPHKADKLAALGLKRPEHAREVAEHRAIERQEQQFGTMKGQRRTSAFIAPAAT